MSQLIRKQRLIYTYSAWLSLSLSILHTHKPVKHIHIDTQPQVSPPSVVNICFLMFEKKKFEKNELRSVVVVSLHCAMGKQYIYTHRYIHTDII